MKRDGDVWNFLIYCWLVILFKTFDDENGESFLSYSLVVSVGKGCLNNYVQSILEHVEQTSSSAVSH